MKPDVNGTFQNETASSISDKQVSKYDANAATPLSEDDSCTFSAPLLIGIFIAGFWWYSSPSSISKIMRGTLKSS